MLPLPAGAVNNSVGDAKSTLPVGSVTGISSAASNCNSPPSPQFSRSRAYCATSSRLSLGTMRTTGIMHPAAPVPGRPGAAMYWFTRVVSRRTRSQKICNMLLPDRRPMSRMHPWSLQGSPATIATATRPSASRLIPRVTMACTKRWGSRLATDRLAPGITTGSLRASSAHVSLNGGVKSLMPAATASGCRVASRTCMCQLSSSSPNFCNSSWKIGASFSNTSPRRQGSTVFRTCSSRSSWSSSTCRCA
mmetsp:Transcript_31412/g.81624  ORF Transcript_31412/g.81624 Transcript_31412/m.81624 type:complete len:249 (-) Transcript_31412:257-1003(-)